MAELFAWLEVHQPPLQLRDGLECNGISEPHEQIREEIDIRIQGCKER